MSIERIIRLLDELHEERSAVASLQTARLEAIENALPPDVKQQLSELDSAIAAHSTVVSEIEEEIRRLVLEHGATVRGSWLQAVYVSPRVTWDTAGLDGYAVAHPEIAVFRREGAPSVSIRQVK